MFRIYFKFSTDSVTDYLEADTIGRARDLKRAYLESGYEAWIETVAKAA